MELDQEDFARIVAQTAARARGDFEPNEHPYEIDRRIETALEAIRTNPHTFSLDTHPAQTAKNRAGQLARRLALNPAEQRRLNRDLLAAIEAMDQRDRVRVAEIARLRIEVDRLLATQRGEPGK
jgi:hypothetical protein